MGDPIVVFRGILADRRFRKLYFEDNEAEEGWFSFILADLKRPEFHKTKPGADRSRIPPELHFVATYWPVDDFIAQVYINLQYWGICPFWFMGHKEDHNLGALKNGEAIETLTMLVIPRPGSVPTNVTYVPLMRKDMVTLACYYLMQNYGMGWDKLYAKMRDSYFNITLRDVKAVMKETSEWQLHMRRSGISEEHVVNHPNLEKGPGRRLQLDTTFLPSTLHHNCILTMVDTFSKKGWAWALRANITGGKGTLKSLQAWNAAKEDIQECAENALAGKYTLAIQTDNGTEFKDAFAAGIRELKKEYPIYALEPSPYTSRATGAVEAFNKVSM